MTWGVKRTVPLDCLHVEFKLPECPVASNPFLGHVKQHLSQQAHKALLRTVAADYTTLDDRELAQRLSAG